MFRSCLKELLRRTTVLLSCNCIAMSILAVHHGSVLHINLRICLGTKFCKMDHGACHTTMTPPFGLMCVSYANHSLEIY